MGSIFRSMGVKTAVKSAKVSFREAATKQLNQVCGNCSGAGNVGSTLMPGESVKCFACDGTGKPNDKVQSLPELNDEDKLRIWKLQQLLEKYPKSRLAIVSLIREQFPDMYQGADGAPN
jgi:1,4-dihydroxy-2-naphthoyl-CoA synthase